MKPISPVIKGYEGYEILLAENQKQYVPIPTIVAEGDDKRFISRWEFTQDERDLIAKGGTLVFQQLTFGYDFQPVCFQVEGPPEIDPNETVKRES